MEKRYEGPRAQPTSTPDPAESRGLKKGEWVAHPGEQQAAPILFYPADPPGTSYHLQVILVDHPEKGVIDYRFTTAPLDQAAFNGLKTDILENDKELRALNYKCRIIIKSSSKDWQTQQFSDSRGSTITQVFTSASMKSTTEMNGKVEEKVRPRYDPKETDVSAYGDPWGEDDQNLILMRVTTGGSTNADKTFKESSDTYFFNYFDKTTHTLNKTILLGVEGSESVISDQYTKIGPLYFKTESTSAYYSARGEMQSKSTSITDQIQINK
jgi:hypothetical protein